MRTTISSRSTGSWSARSAGARSRRSCTATPSSTPTPTWRAASGSWPACWPAWASGRATRWRSWTGTATATWRRYFAVPMMGAVLHTVNVRLSAEQILYTINHAEDRVLLVHKDFLPIIDKIRTKFETVKSIVVISDGQPLDEPRPWLAGDHEVLLEAASDRFDFPTLREDTVATTFYTTGTTGNPKGVFFTHRQLVLHTLNGLGVLGGLERSDQLPVRRRLHADHAHVPRPRLGRPVHRDGARREAGLPGPLRAGDAAQAAREAPGDLLALRPDDPGDAPGEPGHRQRRLLEAGRWSSADRPCRRASPRQRWRAGSTSPRATGCRRPARCSRSRTSSPR